MKRLAIIVMCLLVLGGCTYISDDDRDEESGDYRTGTQGLRMQFLSNMPPSKVYDDESFNVMLRIENRGAEDIEVGSGSKVYLSGYDTSLISGMDNYRNLGRIAGKSRYNREGDFTTKEFSGMISDLTSRNIDSYDFTLMATACYSYATIAEPTVCLSADPHSRTSQHEACNPERDPSVGSQGAPVQISSVDVEPMSGKSKFKISVRNAGAGTVFKDGYQYMSQCDPHGSGLDYSNVNYVEVEEVTVSDTDISPSCEPLKNGMLRLTDGSGYMVCELTGIDQSAYTTPLRITLNYGYRTSIRKPVEVISS